MSEPVLSRVEVSPYADVTFLAEVGDAPYVVTSSVRTVWVRSLETRYRFDFGRSLWLHTVKLTGRRILRDGTPCEGKSVVTFGPLDDMPIWLARIVTQNRPPFILPDMRVRNA